MLMQSFLEPVMAQDEGSEDDDVTFIPCAPTIVDSKRITSFNPHETFGRQILLSLFFRLGK